jgi:hypothetical protein
LQFSWAFSSSTRLSNDNPDKYLSAQMVIHKVVIASGTRGPVRATSKRIFSAESTRSQPRFG